MNKKYIVTLTAEERAMLQEMITVGKRAARTLAHARILLKADVRTDEPVWDDAAISQAVEVSPTTVQRVRQRFVEDGLEAALRPRPRCRGRSQTGPDRVHRHAAGALARERDRLEPRPQLAHETRAPEPQCAYERLLPA